MCALPFVEAARLFLGSMGNKTERAGPLFLSIVLSGPVIAMCIYYLTTQTYVLRVEQVLNGISLGFCGLLSAVISSCSGWILLITNTLQH